MGARAATGDRLRIVVTGGILRWPLGGLAWHYFQYVLGFARLGYDVFYLEDSEDRDWCCWDPVSGMSRDPTYGLAWTKDLFDRSGLHNRWAYYDAHSQSWLGPAAAVSRDVCQTADLVVNVTGRNMLRPWLMRIPTRVLLDTDPTFTQVANLTQPDARARSDQHNLFFTFGENLPGGTARIPDDGFAWRATRQPVVLDAWPVTTGPRDGPFTTLMSWNSYPPLEYDGQKYGMKSDAFAAYEDLPRHVGSTLELALGSPSPIERLTEKGWIIRHPIRTVPDPWAFKTYIQQSKAEFAVAKQAYGVSNSGWFSERSANYLASGRPVVAQETGFSSWLPTGAGVLAFDSVDEAIAAIEDINIRYDYHCRAAREIAAEYFESDKILRSLVERALQGR